MKTTTKNTHALATALEIAIAKMLETSSTPTTALLDALQVVLYERVGGETHEATMAALRAHALASWASEVERTGALPVPEHLRSAPVRGDAPYRNPHEHPHHLVRQEHRPPGLTDRTFYRPADHGEEKTIRARLQWWRERLR